MVELWSYPLTVVTQCRKSDEGGGGSETETPYTLLQDTVDHNDFEADQLQNNS